MPVIVNDLEVVTETPAAEAAPTPSGEGAAPEARAAPAEPPLRPEDLFELLRHEAERAARVCPC
jgi:hypothetical protein